jgi:hypothetical protein
MTSVRTVVLAFLILVMASHVYAQPGGATPIAPSATVDSTTIAFTWNSAATATWYQLWLGRPDASVVLDQWFTAEHAGCAGGATCSITLTPAIGAGAFNWYVRSWNPSGYGPWSAAHTFTVRGALQGWSGILPPSRRFTLVLNNEAVLDNETGLVWHRAPSAGVDVWSSGTSHCALWTIGGRQGWRMPALSELQTLVEPSAGSPSLPPGHPFALTTTPGGFWAQTENASAAGYRYVVNFTNGSISAQNMGNFRFWCVRGGQNLAH